MALAAAAAAAVAQVRTPPASVERKAAPAGVEGAAEEGAAVAGVIAAVVREEEI